MSRVVEGLAAITLAELLLAVLFVVWYLIGARRRRRERAERAARRERKVLDGPVHGFGSRPAGRRP